MKKSIISLGIAALLLVTPTPIYAFTDVVQNQHEQIESVKVAADSVYINSTTGGGYGTPSQIPSTFTYTTVIGNKIYRGVLNRNAGGSYYYDGSVYKGFYSGYVYFTGDYTS